MFSEKMPVVLWTTLKEAKEIEMRSILHNLVKQINAEAVESFGYCLHQYFVVDLSDTQLIKINNDEVVQYLQDAYKKAGWRNVKMNIHNDSFKKHPVLEVSLYSPICLGNFAEYFKYTAKPILKSMGNFFDSMFGLDQPWP